MQALVRHNLLFKKFSKFSTFLNKEEFMHRVILQDELHDESLDAEYRNPRDTVASPKRTRRISSRIQLLSIHVLIILVR
jgi:hypothetical protein